GGNARGCLEGPVTVAQQNRKTRAGVRGRQIKLAVAVEIADGDRFGTAARAVSDGRQKGTVTVADENGDVVRATVRHREIGLSVAIEVATDYEMWMAAAGVAGSALKRTVSVSEEDRDIIGTVVGN